MREQAQVFALWHGGQGYGHSDPTDDLECFPSMQTAREAFAERATRGDSWRQRFAYVNRAPEAVYCPCVENSSMTLWFGLEPDEDGRYSAQDAYPDRILTIGPRGGVRAEHC